MCNTHVAHNFSEFRGKTPFVGIYVNRTPQLLVVDPALAKEIFVGKFKYFPNNDTNVSKLVFIWVGTKKTRLFF